MSMCEQQILSAAYALDSLDRAERAAYDQHLLDCARCRDAVLRSERSCGALAESVPQIDPPDRLRRSILDAIAEQPQETTARRLAGNARKSRMRLVCAGAAAVVVMALVGLGIAGGQMGFQRDVQAERNTNLQTVVEQAAQPGATLVELRSKSSKPAAVVAVARANRTVFLPTGLAATPPGKVYVLWGLSDGSPVAMGTFSVDDSRSEVHTVGLPDGVKGFGVSLEQGSTAPAQPSNVVASQMFG